MYSRPALVLLAFLVQFAGLLSAAAQEPASGPAEVLAEVRVHGNHTTPDAEVLRIAGLTLRAPITPATIEQVEQRLGRSGRFQSVEVRKRYRSLSRLDEVSLIIVVREHPVPEDPAAPTPAVLRPVRRLLASGMVLPILDYTDGYGFTYGARVSFVHVLGRDGRVSVPLTWGGTRRAAVELDKRLRAGPLDRVVAGIGLSRRENPFYELGERRSDAWLGAGGHLAGPLRAGLRAGVSDVRFGEVDERVGTYGADLFLDTRQDPVFPRNAIYLAGSWDAIRPDVSGQANRYRMEARGYAGLVRQAVLSLRWQYSTSDAPLPLYERALLGGAGSVRGYRAGFESGDNLMAMSAEIRLPLNSPLGISRAGVTFFADAGRVWEHGAKAADSPFRKGGGVGVFFLASVIQLNADLAIREGGGARLHFSTGVQF